MYSCRGAALVLDFRKPLCVCHLVIIIIHLIIVAIGAIEIRRLDPYL